MKLPKVRLARSWRTWQGALDCDLAAPLPDHENTASVSSCARRAAANPPSSCGGEEMKTKAQRKY